MKQRLESTGQAIQNEMVVKVSDYKKLLEGEKLSGWNVKPLKGKGVDIEQEILDILADEEMKVVDMILGNLPRILDTYIYEEMGKRKPESLEVKFP